MLIHSDPNNMNSIVYHLIIERYSMKTLHWYFPWATALDLYNMTGRGEKLQQLHCYHPFSDSLDIYLTKNHYENYSPKMVPIAEIWGSGSWTIICTTAMVRVVWIQLISFDLQPQIHKNYNGAHIKGMHRMMLKYSHMIRAELASIVEQ